VEGYPLNGSAPVKFTDAVPFNGYSPTASGFSADHVYIYQSGLCVLPLKLPLASGEFAIA